MQEEQFKTLEQVKAEYAQQVWIHTKNKVKAAKILGVDRMTLARLLKKLKENKQGVIS
jgi:DNA-binding NtrC family response regulator